MPIDDTPSPDELAEYRERARSWLKPNMPPIDQAIPHHRQDNAHLKALMRTLHSGGYSGICFPTEVGGAGLSREHHRVFCAEAAGYELPAFASNPGLAIVAPPILEFGTDAQKQHIRAMLEGRAVFAQLMSEPSGGSNMAGALTRADRDGDSWILNGSKVWSSGAWRADWGLLLARTNWDVPKHQGLSMFLVDLKLPGVEVRPIKMVDGRSDFCEEFFRDVVVPDACLLGAPGGGWTVAQNLLYHERNSAGGGSPYAFNREKGREHGGTGIDLTEIARRRGSVDDPRVHELLGEAYVLDLVAQQLVDRVTDAIRAGVLPAIAGSMLRLSAGERAVRRSTIALELGGVGAVTWERPDEAEVAMGYVRRQALCIGGGTTEMQRNLVSERLMGMPREPAADVGVPFRVVRH